MQQVGEVLDVPVDSSGLIYIQLSPIYMSINIDRAELRK